MDTLRLLLVLLAASASESSGTVQPLCENYDMESYLLLEGEAFYFESYIVKYLTQPLNVTWYKNASNVEYVSADVKDRVHYQGSALFLLDLVPEDSGVYVARLVESSGQCSNAFLNVTVLKSSYKNNSDVFYGEIQTSDKNPEILCPQVVKKTCDDLKGNITWYKDFSLIKEEHENFLWVHSATKHHEGVYTCVCSWTHNDKVHVTSGSRELKIKGPGANYDPTILSPTSEKQICDEGAELKVNCSVFCGTNVDICEAGWYINGKAIDHMDGYSQSRATQTANNGRTMTRAVLTIHKVSAQHFLSKFECRGNTRFETASTALTLERRERVCDLEFISPEKHEQFAEEGAEIRLNCSVSCEAKDKCCHASWNISDQQMVGYNQSTEIVIGPSHNVSIAVLTIAKVSAKDFETEFQCITSKKSITVIVKRKESVVPMVVRGLCVLLLCVFAAVLVRCFALDLALVFRRCSPGSSRDKDMKLYDAYVVYQTENLDKTTEDALGRFVMSTLPSVLEEKCGYRLFIHGRDDKPGEDSLELAEDRMKQSRRLIVILTLGSETQHVVTEKTPAVTHNSDMRGFDWQVGLKETLVQRDKNVILIELEDLGPEGHARLCPTMQRLVPRSPIRWQEGSQGAAAYNSHFWKRVRYLMPAVPVRRCPPSAPV